MLVALDAKRRLTVPAALAPAKPGDVFQSAFDAEEDTIVFRRLTRAGDWLAILERCPVPMDDLPPRRREYFRSRLRAGGWVPTFCASRRRLTLDPKVIAWLRNERDRCYTSAVVIAQLAYWVRTKRGRQPDAFHEWLTR